MVSGRRTPQMVTDAPGISAAAAEPREHDRLASWPRNEACESADWHAQASQTLTH
jgi:hypothetical protein